MDAIDNGISQYDTTEPPKYVSNTSLGSRVAALNPRWNQDSSDEVLMAQFLKAVQLTGGEFKECVEYVGQCWLPARSHVRVALEQLSSIDASCQVLFADAHCIASPLFLSSYLSVCNSDHEA